MRFQTCGKERLLCLNQFSPHFFYSFWSLPLFLQMYSILCCSIPFCSIVALCSVLFLCSILILFSISLNPRSTRLAIPLLKRIYQPLQSLTSLPWIMVPQGRFTPWWPASDVISTVWRPSLGSPTAVSPRRSACPRDTWRRRNPCWLYFPSLSNITPFIFIPLIPGAIMSTWVTTMSDNLVDLVYTVTSVRFHWFEMCDVCVEM